MGCRCNQRGQAISKGASALARGNLAGAGKAAAYVGRTLAQDVRSGDLQRAARQRLADLRRLVRPR